MSTTPSEMRILIILSIFLSIAVSGCTSSASYSENTQDDQQSEPLPSEPTEITPAIQNAVERGVKSRLKDPNSAKFGPMAGAIQEEVLWVCGTVNAKNSFGGYTGQSVFIGGFDNTEFVLASIADDEDMTRIVLQNCAEKGVGQS